MMWSVFRCQHWWSDPILPMVCKRSFPNGGSTLVRRANSRTPPWLQFTSIWSSYLALHHLHLFLTSFTSCSPLLGAISNHGLEATVYRPLDLVQRPVILEDVFLQTATQHCRSLTDPLQRRIIAAKKMPSNRVSLVACCLLSKLQASVWM